jgi:hypothetical protein
MFPQSNRRIKMNKLFIGNNSTKNSTHSTDVVLNKKNLASPNYNYNIGNSGILRRNKSNITCQGTGTWLISAETNNE